MLSHSASQRNRDLRSYLLIHRYGQDFRDSYEPETEVDIEIEDDPASPWYWNELEDLPPRMIAKDVGKCGRPLLIKAIVAERAQTRAQQQQELEAALWLEPMMSDGYVAHREEWF